MKQKYYHHQSISNSILLIDPPGFQPNIYEKNNTEDEKMLSAAPASISDLMCNYLKYYSNYVSFPFTFSNVLVLGSI